MLQNQINLFHAPLADLFQSIRTNSPSYFYDYKRHTVSINNSDDEPLGFIRLPLHYCINDELVIIEQQPYVLYLTLESGNASICVMKGNQNVYHTSFSSYMTRKKQGFSQIKYLNKKGKSRAGSRVRLTATIEFFENINLKLIELFENYEFERIALNCSTTLVPYLHQSKVHCPFDKKDGRLYKIPLHLPQSNYTNLQAAIKKLMAPILFYDDKHKEVVELIKINKLIESQY